MSPSLPRPRRRSARISAHDGAKAFASRPSRSRRDRMLNALRRTRAMAFRGVDVVTGRANAVPGRSRAGAEYQCAC